MKLLLSPHNDDETLFAAYIAMRERPKVIVALDGGPGHKTRVDPEVRVAESAAAMEVLDCPFEHLGFPVDIRDWDPVAERLASEPGVERAWVPVPEPGGHRHHNRLAAVALEVFGRDRVSFYSTYRCDTTGWPIRTTHGRIIDEEHGWPELKSIALECYVSQIMGEGTRMHFERPLTEYEMPRLRLNLGGGINPIAGYVNLDRSTGWRFEDGLGDYPDGSVEAITESHSLMYVSPADWPAVFTEIARVLQPGGIVRMTHDNIGGFGSSRPRIRPNAAVATTPALLLAHLEDAGLQADIVAPDESALEDGTLVQQNYGRPPDVFHVEAVKPATAALHLEEAAA